MLAVIDPAGANPGFVVIMATKLRKSRPLETTRTNASAS